MLPRVLELTDGPQTDLGRLRFHESGAIISARRLAQRCFLRSLLLLRQSLRWTIPAPESRLRCEAILPGSGQVSARDPPDRFVFAIMDDFSQSSWFASSLPLAVRPGLQLADVAVPCSTGACGFDSSQILVATFWLPPRPSSPRLPPSGHECDERRSIFPSSSTLTFALYSPTLTLSLLLNNVQPTLSQIDPSQKAHPRPRTQQRRRRATPLRHLD